MKVLRGFVGFPGLVKGKACLYAESDNVVTSRYNIPQENVEREIGRLTRALAKARKMINDMLDKREDSVDDKLKQIFDIHNMILSDKGLQDKISDLISKEHVNAEHAVDMVFDAYIDKYRGSDGHFKELIHDFIDLKNRVIGALSNKKGRFICVVNDKPVIVISKILTPSMVLDIPRKKILAFVTKEGGYTSHAMILARSLGVPVIFNVDIDDNFKCEDKVIVDGFQGEVVINPDSDVEKQFDKKLGEYNSKAHVCSLKKHEAPHTQDNVKIKLKLNISTPEELGVTKDYYHDGIGLLRTEFLFLDRSHPPTEEEQFKMYKKVLRETKDKEVVIRLLDIGSDKWPLFFESLDQTNPDMEIKGARAVEYFYDTYLAQAKAILRAAVYGNVKILYPMISDISDIDIYQKLIEAARNEVAGEGQKFKENISFGIMIETPAAAIMIDTLIKYVDFVNVGSNDLLQYTLAASRNNPFVEKRYHMFHPAIVRLLDLVIKAGNKYNKEVCVCGEIGSFEQFYPVLLKLGVRSFSVSVSKFSYLKCELMHMREPEEPELFDKIYNAKSKEELDRIYRIN